MSRQGWKQQHIDKLEALKQIKEGIRILEDWKLERDRKQRMDLSQFEHASHTIVRVLETNKKLSSE